MSEQTKAKRRLTDISFDHEGSHVALVSKYQGGPANNVTTLITKATDDINIEKASEEEIQKAVEVNLTVSLLDFLTRYLNVCIDEAETIAGMLGYTYEDLYQEDDIDGFKEMVQSNLDKVSINKSKSANKFIENFEEFNKKFFQKNSQPSVVSQGEDDVKTEGKETTKSKEESTDMTDQTVEKSEMEIELQKAKEQLADLQKAKEEAEQFKKEKEDLEKSFSEVNKTVEVLKAAEEKRKEQEFLQKAAEHSHVVNDDLPAADLAKALRVAEETEGCEALVKAFESYRDLFKNESALEEIGKSKTEDQPTGSKLDAAIEKAQKEHDVDYMKAIDIVKAAQPDLFNEEYA